MKIKFFTFVISVFLMIVGFSNCSKEKDYDPDDYVTSWLTGDYGNGQLWDLDVSLNDKPVDDYGYVRFESKDLKVADFRFVRVIPSESEKEFKHVPLTTTEEGVTFTIEYNHDNTPVVIKGVVDFGIMSVKIQM